MDSDYLFGNPVAHLLNGFYIQVDETTMGVQTHDGRGKDHQAIKLTSGNTAGQVDDEARTRK
jgi:hypothetical protein